ncbi:MAG TPA: GTP 3',8-cyclase MoaA [Pyrinomonadaceae bacterium]|nr:GTP 3',8-cyclase MoaA [Pyrinomonadaceae bacterium]
MEAALKDSYGRAIRDLRVSVTDKCNFRCFYCLPHGSPQETAPKSEVLTYEEIELAVEVFASLGVEKVRLTGGEPMLRRDIETLVAKLARVPGVRDLALTTNAYNLAERAAGLKAAGLDRVTVSLDSLRRAAFHEMTGVDMLGRVLEGVRAAVRVGLAPVKVNAVIVRGYNEDEVADMAAFAREHAVTMRFIEYMPLDSGHGWSREKVVSGAEIRAAINERFLLVAKHTERGSETATRYRFADGAPGEVGIIAPVTEPFCGACSRVRLTADGQIRTCLFSKAEHSLRDPMRAGATREELADYVRSVVKKKEPRHYINETYFEQPARTMSLIGG